MKLRKNLLVGLLAGMLAVMGAACSEDQGVDVDTEASESVPGEAASS